MRLLQVHSALTPRIRTGWRYIIDIYVVRAKGTLANTVLLGKVEGKRSRSRPEILWLDDVKECTGVARIFIWRGHPALHQSFEAVADSWVSVRAPTVSRVMGEAPERNKKMTKYR